MQTPVVLTGLSELKQAKEKDNNKKELMLELMLCYCRGDIGRNGNGKVGML